MRTAAPSAQLSYSLRCRLEKCEFPKRTEVCSMSKDGCSPLFIACKRGNVEVRRMRQRLRNSNSFLKFSPFSHIETADFQGMVEPIVTKGGYTNFCGSIP